MCVCMIVCVSSPQVTVISGTDGSAFSKRSNELVIVDDPAAIAQCTAATMLSLTRQCPCLSLVACHSRQCAQ